MLFHLGYYISQHRLLYKRYFLIIYFSPSSSRCSKGHHSSQRLDSLHRNGHRYRLSEPLSSPSFAKGIYLRAELFQHCCGQGEGIENEL